MDHLRYKYVRRHKTFGKSVYKHLQDCKTKLLEDHPRRKPFLNLIRDLSQYVMKKKKNIADNKSAEKVKAESVEHGANN